ncbi:MAG: hypothetical protein WCB85_01740 [Candidatus Dormiibacterota bacterium]
MNDLSDTTTSLDHELGAAAAREPLGALTTISSLRSMLTAHEREAVRAALARHSWSEIGRAMGVSKQAAFQRFGKQWIREIKTTMSPSEIRDAVRRRYSADERPGASKP